MRRYDNRKYGNHPLNDRNFDEGSKENSHVTENLRKREQLQI